MMRSNKQGAHIEVSMERPLLSLPPTFAPSLVLSHGKKFRDQTFCTLSDGCHHVRSVVEMRQMRCVASCYGWLILQNYYSTQCYLFNPISLSKITLPHLPHHAFHFGVLTSSPSDPNCFVVLFSGKKKSHKSLVFCRISGTKWFEQNLGCERKGPIFGVTSCKRSIYLSLFSGLAVIDVHDARASIKFYESKSLNFSLPEACWTSEFIVESCGDIFQVVAIYSGMLDNVIQTCDVFKLDMANNKMDWVNVESLGDRIFLLGKSPISLSASEFGMKGNCIYFALPSYTNLYKFDMDNGTITVTLASSETLPHWGEPFWVLPNCTRQVVPSFNKDVVKFGDSNGEEERNWDLQTELLQFILSSLYQGDCIRFRLTCKSWISVLPPIRSNPLFIQSNSGTQNLPWLMSFPKTNKGVCYMYHPIYSDTYVMDFPELAGAIIRHAKYGWWLMSRGDTSIFFFNPLTKEIIKLPDLEFGLGYGFVGISFTAPPTSPCCIVFGHRESHRDRVHMELYIQGDEETEDGWYGFSFQNKIPYNFVVSSCNPVYLDGVFYCLSKDGKLGVFNPMETEGDLLWRILPVPAIFQFSKLHHFCAPIRSFIVEFAGEILSVFLGFEGKTIQIYKLDKSKMEWVKVESLGDKVLFLSPTTAILVPAELKGTENRIYISRFHGQNNLFYSLSTGSYHYLGSKCSRRDWIGTSENWHCTWFQPTNEQLNATANPTNGK